MKTRRFAWIETLQIAVTFFLSGLLSGAILTWLIELPISRNFKILRDDAAWASNFIGILLLSLSLVLPLAVGALVSPVKITLAQKQNLSLWRCLLACAVIVAALPLLTLLCTIFPFFYGNLWVTLPAFILIIAFAMCIATKSLRLIPIAFLFCGISLTLAVTTTVLLYPLVRAGSYEGLFLHFTPFFAMLSLCFGLWLHWLAAKEE